MEYKDGMTGGKRVAFVLNPYKPDYHWYVYDEEKEVWNNKNGGKEATNKPLERDRENYGKDDITDYTKAAELIRIYHYAWRVLYYKKEWRGI